MDRDKIEQLRAFGPVGEEAAKIIEIVYSDPTTRLFLSLAKFVDAACEEIDEIALAGKIIKGSKKESPEFERINQIVKSFSEYSSVFRSGREAMVKHGLLEQESDSGGNLVSKRAARRSE